MENVVNEVLERLVDVQLVEHPTPCTLRHHDSRDRLSVLGVPFAVSVQNADYGVALLVGKARSIGRADTFIPETTERFALTLPDGVFCFRVVTGVELRCEFPKEGRGHLVRSVTQSASVPQDRTLIWLKLETSAHCQGSSRAAREPEVPCGAIGLEDRVLSGVRDISPRSWHFAPT